MESSQAPEVTRDTARRFLKALSDGVPPHNPLTGWFTVGQKNLMLIFHEDLKAVANDDFRSLLLLGDPGAGKSQLLITLQYLAIKQGFVTAYFAQDIQSKLGFNRPDQIYQRIIETMRLPQNPEDPTDPLRTIMDEWVDQSLPKLRGTNRSMAIIYKLSELGLLPRKLEQVHRRTRFALVGYIIATEQQNEDAKLQFLSVLKGSGLSNSRLAEIGKTINYQRRVYIGYTPSIYDTDYYFSQLGTIIFILRSLGYQGMAVLFDEVTSIIDLGTRSRKKAYKVLDSLFVNKYEYRGLYTVFAYMPPFIIQLRSDEWLTGRDYSERWQFLFDERMLELASLDKQDIQELLRRLSDLHGIARDWPAWNVMRSHAQDFIRTFKGNALPTREFVRKGLNLLDQLHVRYREG